MPKVIIISTGDELLFGTTVNTNSSFISNLFFGSNFDVIKHITVGDQIEYIVNSINNSLEEADVIITTGGLGPTDDDNTVEAICSIFNRKIIIDNESNEKILEFFKSMNMPLNKVDSKMAMVPENSFVIQNRYGLSPAFIISEKNKTVISLPGVPSESENIMKKDVLPYLKSNYSFDDNMKLTYKMSGIRESDINSELKELNLPDYVRIGITSKMGICELTITNLIKEKIQREDIDLLIKNKFNEYLLGHNAESPEQELIILLKEKGLTLSTAESCTGGLIAKKITDVPGSSEVFMGSVVAYDNNIKSQFLDVSDDTLRKFGAVSEQTAQEMAHSIQKKFKTDISVSTTGIAGPGGGSESKPVGTVCFGFKIKDHQYTVTRTISGNRARVRIFSSLYAINYLRDFLKKLN
ncbi:MAG: CinA family nicotinamide mononucleotide deamidase-related protein [Leptospirales bacterium]|nr:CinA family nicotinamide mononucleotide deamidase-related protein [Leptospirales bacterium]